ncbi:MAG: cupin domain-containing protein [Candidatus Ozemobacteraceae bacterium]
MPNKLSLGLLAALLIVPVFEMAFPHRASARGKEKQETAAAESHRFFTFDGAPYYTSSDKRIGAKMLIDSARVGPTLTAMQHLTYLPGAHVKSHRHVYVTEVIYILKGHLTLRIEKETKVMSPDTTAYIPPQTFHEYLNDPASGEVCQFLQFYSPSGPEEEYRNWERPGEEATKTAKIAVATGPQEIKRGPLPAIPGSPHAFLDAPKEVAGNATSSATTTEKSELKLNNSPLSPATRSYELKFSTTERTASITPVLGKHRSPKVSTTSSPVKPTGAAKPTPESGKKPGK